MGRCWLVLDVNYLANRAYYATPGLSHEDAGTAVAFGVLRDIRQLEAMFGTRYFAFCFDHGPYLRRKLFLGYKASRDKLTDEQRSVRAAIREQTDRLRDEILPSIGYRNVFHMPGYEADDVMASVVRNLGGREESVLVTADKDVYQLIGPGVVVYHPREGVTVNEASFPARYWGIQPRQWAAVKAIAGCAGDDVPGVHGVGEKTAAEFVRAGGLRAGGRTLTSHRKYPDINAFIASLAYRRNIELVRLPFRDTPEYKAEPHPAIDPAAWDAACESLGITTLPSGRHHRSVK